MVVKYLLATLSALAKKITPSSAINITNDSDATYLYKGSINYMNVSPIFGRFPRRRRWAIDFLPRSIIMAMSCFLFFVIPFKAFAAVATKPTIAASAVTISAISGTGATIAWTKGNGSIRAVFVFAGSTGTPAPIDGTTYTASTTFGTAGSQLATSGWYCVYINTGTTVTINGLSAGTTYRVMVVEYNTGTNAPKTAYLLTTNGTNPVNFTTLQSISYTGSPFSYAVNIAISSLTPTVTGSPTGYTISPALPSGLSISPTTGVISGTATATSAATTYTITANYAVGSPATTTINIQVVNAVTLTITATNITQTYGSVTTSGLAYTYSGWINGDGPGSMIVLPTISTTATSTSGAGTYSITVSGGQAPAYYNIVYAPGTFTINKATLNIVATGPPKLAGATVTSPQTSTAYFTASGLIGGESISTVQLSINPTTAQTAGQSYTVTPGSPTGANGFDVNNYNITYTVYNGQCGQDYIWAGTTNTIWSTGTNWSPNGVPGTNDNVFIPATTNKPEITATTTVNTITITGNTTVTIDANVNMTFLNGFAINSGTKSTISMTPTSQVIVGTTSSHAIMDNLGQLTVSGGTLYITWGLNYIYNETNALMTCNNGNILDIGGTSGQLAFQNNGTFKAGTSNSACTLNIVNSQSVTNGATGNFYIGSTSSINFLDATAHDSHFSNTLGGNFVFQSDQYGTASVGKIPNNPGTHQNSFDGTFTCERYISGYRGYRIMASPVYAATTSGASGSNKVYSLNYVQSFTFLSGTNAAGGFDKVSSGPSLYIFREDVPFSNVSFTSGNFQSINNLSSGTASTPTYTFDVTAGSWSIPVSNGFLCFYRGNRNDATYTAAQQFTAGTPAVPVTMSTTGYLTQQQVVYKDWYTPTSNLLPRTNSYAVVAGFHLAANPYACSIDWNTQQSSSTTTGIYALNLAPYIYEYNQRTGNYDTYNSNGTYTNNGTRTIMSGQAFFVVALPGSGQLIFNEGAKSTTLQNTGLNLFMGKPADMLARNQSLRIQIAKDTINKDDAFIKFDPNAKATFNVMEDAPYKGGSGKVNIATISSDNQTLAINLLPFNNQGQTIRVKMNASSVGTDTIKMTEINGISKLFDVLLADNYAKDTIDMREGPYGFSISTDTGSYGAHRFAIVLRQNPAYAYQLLSFNAQKMPFRREVKVVWDTKYEADYTNFTVERSTDGGSTFTVLGGVPATGAGNYGFTDKHPAEGINLYRLKQEDINNKVTYSRIVPVAYGNPFNYFAQNRISIYPNPAAGRINLAIADPLSSSSSAYDILISSSSGRMLKKVTSNQPYWQGDAGGWMPGTYLVKVFDTKTQSLIGTTKFIKL
jgi:hypothetical protein